MQSEHEVPPPVPPAKPNSVPGALQQSMPLADVMDVIAKPPGSAPPFIPYKPAPPLVPMPERHTLTVRRPHVLNDRAAFGDLAEQPLQVPPALTCIVLANDPVLFPRVNQSLIANAHPILTIHGRPRRGAATCCGVCTWSQSGILSW